MGEAEKKLEAEVQALLQEAARVDAEEDGKYGKGKCGDALRGIVSAAGEPVRKDSAGEGGAGARGERGWS